MKVIHILLIIIFILFTILGVKVYNSNKGPEYSLLDIVDLFEKADKLQNYECEIDLNGYLYYKKKDNKMAIKSEDDKIVYRDYDKNIEIYCSITNGKKYYIEKEPIHKNIPSANLYTTTIGTDELLKLDIQVVSIKKKKYNGTTCLEAKLKDNNEKEFVFLIDMDTGLTVKAELPEGVIKEYTYKFNTVTDEDVIPDLTGYTKIPYDDI